MPAAPAGEIFRNPAGSVIPIPALPRYLNTYTFMAVPLTGAAGTNPLYPGDPAPGLTGAPLTIALPLSGDIRIILHTRPASPDGWYVLTSYPMP